jgi:hypothetical protein
MDDDVRLRRLEDLEEIRQLFTDYGRHLDAGDVQAYAELFADDGEVLLGPIGRDPGGKLEVAMFGRHQDDLVRERGRWRLKKRRGRMDVPAGPPR